MFSNQMDGFATLSSAVANQISYEKPNVPIWKGFHPIADNLPAIISTKEARSSLGWPLDKKIVLFFEKMRFKRFQKAWVGLAHDHESGLCKSTPWGAA